MLIAPLFTLSPIRGSDTESMGEVPFHVRQGDLYSCMMFHLRVGRVWTVWIWQTHFCKGFPCCNHVLISSEVGRFCFSMALRERTRARQAGDERAEIVWTDPNDNGAQTTREWFRWTGSVDTRAQTSLREGIGTVCCVLHDKICSTAGPNIES